MELQGVDHVAFAVGDLTASIEWYRTVLGLSEQHPEWERHPAMMMRGGSGVALFATDGTPPGNDRARFLHLAFRVDRASFQEAQQRLADREVPFEVVDHGSAHSLYFSDPDGVRLELTTYEV
jgi:catechol 2,3-dioxygenase-like lactoylglutathione lyase family enzyme